MIRIASFVLMCSALIALETIAGRVKTRNEQCIDDGSDGVCEQKKSEEKYNGLLTNFWNFYDNAPLSILPCTEGPFCDYAKGRVKTRNEQCIDDGFDGVCKKSEENFYDDAPARVPTPLPCDILTCARRSESHTKGVHYYGLGGPKPAEGTFCDYAKICKGGECVDDEKPNYDHSDYGGFQCD